MSSADSAPAPLPSPTTPRGPSENQRRLRRWIVDQGATAADPGQRIRDEFQRSALSATLRRLIFFGLEGSLNRYTAGELLQFQLMVAGDFADYLAKVTWTRAVVEDDRPVLQALADSRMVDDQVAWTLSITADLSAYAGEELHVARLIRARCAPAEVAPDWLWDVPESLPRLGAALAQALLQGRSDLAAGVATWLHRRPDALASTEPDDLLVALVSASAAHPQTVLEPFAGWYGDRTVAAAAAWHLEHGEPREALSLCGSIRVLGPSLARARLIAGLASLELGDDAQADDILAAMPDGADADILRLRLAERVPTAVADHDLQRIASAATVDRPQAFFTAVRLLVGRQRLDLARPLCRDHRGRFAGHPEVQQLIAAVVGPSP